MTKYNYYEEVTEAINHGIIAPIKRAEGLTSEQIKEKYDVGLIFNKLYDLIETLDVIEYQLPDSSESEWQQVVEFCKVDNLGSICECSNCLQEARCEMWYDPYENSEPMELVPRGWVFTGDANNPSYMCGRCWEAENKPC